MPTETTAYDHDARIDLQEDAGLGYWKQELGCSANELLAAMESVGTDASDVARFLSSAR